MSQGLPHLSRRKFMGLMGSAALATPVLGNNILGANDRVRLGLIGCGAKARNHLKTFKGIAGVEFVAVSDPDTERMDECAELWQQGNTPRPVPDKIRDYRKLLERKDIDGVVLVTPNHWHALQSIHALQAGKHVYVEKPVTHDLHEGRHLVAAVERYGRIVQAGYQCRSDKGPIEGFRYVQEGGLGKFFPYMYAAFETGSLSAARRRRCHLLLHLTTISGWGRRRTCPSIARSFTTTGIGISIPATGTWATNAPMKLTWPAGYWATVRCRRPSAVSEIASLGTTPVPRRIC